MKPNYARKTISSSLQDYSNTPQDRIRESFRASNFVFIKRLPKVWPPRRTVTPSNARKSRWSKTPQPSMYEWMPDSYNNFRIQLSQERKDNEKKQRAISPKVFKTPGPSKLGKQHHGFSDTLGGYLGINDPYEGHMQHINRLKWIDECHKIDTFKPPLKNKTCVNPKDLKNTAKHLKHKLIEDWSDTSFKILVSDLSIEIRFEKEEDGLLAYMNVLVKTDLELLQFSKDSEQWGKYRNTLYVLRPKGIRYKSSLY